MKEPDLLTAIVFVQIRMPQTDGTEEPEKLKQHEQKERKTSSTQNELKTFFAFCHVAETIRRDNED